VASPHPSIPDPDTAVAIAAAYLAVTRERTRIPTPGTPPWRLAGRLPFADDARVRRATRVASRWSAAGRLDV
jgi:hypothetical protein